MLTAIAIDDEPKALEIIEIHAVQIPFLELKRCFRDAVEAVGWLRDNPVDVVFLDINMPNLSGLKFRRLLGEQPMIVFTTAYSEYAVESYEQGAVDYLVKPIRFERFLQAVLRAERWKSPERDSAPPPDKANSEPDPPSGQMTIYIKSGLKLVRLQMDQILFLKKDGNYICFHTTDDKRVLARLSTAAVLELLPAQQFFQVHKSYIVALPHIRELGQQQVRIGKTDIPVTRERWKELLERLEMRY